MSEKQKLSFSWDHGLGDTANALHVLRLYRERGFEIEVKATPDKWPLFELVGCTRTEKPAYHHGWGYPAEWPCTDHGHHDWGNKTAANLSRKPWPDIGERGLLWQELVERVNRRTWENLLSDRLPPEVYQRVGKMLEGAGIHDTPILIHAVGNTDQVTKSLPSDVQLALYRQLIDRTDLPIVVLDWDNRCPRIRNGRWRHLSDLGTVGVLELLALIEQSAVIIGCDSGPIHMATHTRTPAIALCAPAHHASRYFVPREDTLFVTLGEDAGINRFKRVRYPLIEQPGDAWSAEFLSRKAAELLDDSPRHVQVRHWIGELCRGWRGQAGAGQCHDRNRSFELALSLAPHGDFVETGTIRAEEDWGGAGFGTYLLGAFLHFFRPGCKLFSADTGERNVAFARRWTQEFSESVEIHHSRGDDFLKGYAGQGISLLYLDSCDTDHPEHSEVCLREAEAGLPKLLEEAVILIDDTPWIGRQWTGKGALAVPWLLDQGFKVRYAGHQVVLTR